MNDEELAALYDRVASRRAEPGDRRKLVADPRVAEILARSLFWLDDAEPDEEELQAIGFILSYLSGRSRVLGVETFDDVLETEAEVVRCHVKEESDGVELKVYYRFDDGRGRGHKFLMEMSREGFSRSTQRWRDFWAAGRRLRCRFSAAEPGRHRLSGIPTF